jgi:hypothetical protein
MVSVVIARRLVRPDFQRVGPEDLGPFSANALTLPWSGRINAAMTDLVLKSGATSPMEYEVLAGDHLVGSVMLFAEASSSRQIWAWVMDHHTDRLFTHGYEPTREAALQALASSWHREV